MEEKEDENMKGVDAMRQGWEKIMRKKWREKDSPNEDDDQVDRYPAKGRHVFWSVVGDGREVLHSSSNSN